jgi:hypothetical protein
VRPAASEAGQPVDEDAGVDAAGDVGGRGEQTGDRLLGQPGGDLRDPKGEDRGRRVDL